jgi:phage-related protein
MKPVVFFADTLKVIREFPDAARAETGFQLSKLQRGGQPNDFKPMPTIGKGVEELRIWDANGTFRVVYTARLGEAVYILHAFQKKTEKTAGRDIDLAKARFLELKRSIL